MRHFRANLLAIPIILLASWFSIQIRSGIAQQKENLDICSEDSLKTLILGDSHARTALNPEFIGSACSSAQKAEELEYSYYKLKRALETHEEIENLIITVSSAIIGCWILTFMLPKKSIRSIRPPMPIAI